MFDTKEEKANFKLENKSHPRVRHFLTDIQLNNNNNNYIIVYIYKVTKRKPYVNIISENNIGPQEIDA